jgi:hypothetical protein
MTVIPLTELAAVIRSKNAGPYELTFDIMFKDARHYRQVKDADVFTPQLIAQLYGVTPDKVLNVTYFDPAWAVKVTIVRPVVSGGIGETDVYGAQQHAPLLTLTIPIEEE